MSKSRIDYIDIMRGITMILVVYSHVLGLNNPPPLDGGDTALNISSINEVLRLIRMPLFFFISGFFVYSANYNFQLFVQRAKNRLVRQLYPTVLLWGLYCLMFVNLDGSLLHDPYKQGYWFTFVAVEMFILMAPIIMLLSEKRTSLLIKNIVLMTYAAAVELAANRLIHAGYDWVAVTSMEMINGYFPYFFMGIMYKLNFDRLKPIMLNIYTASAALLAFVLGINHIIPLPPFGAGTLGIVFVHYIIYKIFSIDHVAKTKISAALRYIGSMTLEIYLLHYFFMRLLIAPMFLHCRWLADRINTPLELHVYLSISIFVVGLCLAAVYVMKRIRIYPVIFPSIKKR